MSAPAHHPLVGHHGEQASLFADEEVAGPAEPAARRRRHIHLVKVGRHPITLYLRKAFSAGLALHPLAPRSIDARPSPYRCGTCSWCQPLDLDATGAKAWKCFRWPDKVTRGSATTVRLMWPACREFRPPAQKTEEAPDGAAPAPR